MQDPPSPHAQEAHAQEGGPLDAQAREAKDQALEDSPTFDDSLSHGNAKATDQKPEDGASGKGQENSSTDMPELFDEEADETAEVENGATNLAEQLAQEKDNLLRLHAEMENLRRRTSREIAEERRYGSLPLIRDLLPVVDNIDRAIQTTVDQNGSGVDDLKQEESETDADSSTMVSADGEQIGVTATQDSLLEGFKLVRQQMLTLLEQYHCQPIKAEGQPFDPKFHEAIMQQASDDHPAGSVAMVTQTGYIMHDRVVRAPQVIVSTGPSPK